MPNIFNQLNALKKLQPIIMLSHMRANTSLFGHILGNNPEINGYYEMHIGYHSWKSLFRQKLKFLENHSFKQNSKYIFDKVLHDEHYINCELLNTSKAKVIISLRSPEETIPSIINLYQGKVDPDHEFATFNGAVKYYKKRLNSLSEYAIKLNNNFIYLDANDLKENTKKTFSFLQKELSLMEPLTSEYSIQNMTGRGESGDHSDNLKLGKINQIKTDFSSIEIDEEIIKELSSYYKNIRSSIIENSANKSYLQ